MDLEILRYPIGRVQWLDHHSPEDRTAYLEVIRETPVTLRRIVSDLTDKQLDTPYRPDGWTVRQVVHHYADDHMQSYIRFKLALTESTPTISTWQEAVWAELPDAREGPIEPSLQLLDALHQRWVKAWESLSEDEWRKAFYHPKRGPVTLAQLAALYAWHGQHHVAQVQALRVRNGWT